jgi:hypothetical protein
MRILEIPNDNEYWYKALKEWVSRDPENRGRKKLSDLTTSEFLEILIIWYFEILTS